MLAGYRARIGAVQVGAVRREGEQDTNRFAHGSEPRRYPAFPDAASRYPAVIMALPMISMDAQEIAAILPHRYPMLMVDRILEINNDSIVGVKNVTVNEPHFTGHFPGFPVMPGVLIIEAMAQVAGVLVAKQAPHTRGKIMFLASVEDAKFRKPVFPGDQLRIEMKMVRLKTTIAKMQGSASVDGQVVAEATLMCKLTERLSAAQPAPEVPEPQME